MRRLGSRALDLAVDFAIYVASIVVAVILAAFDTLDWWYGRPKWPDNE